MKSDPRNRHRLRSLHSYEVLDTERERDFDDIANLAAALCGTPIALVSLIDAERQWFKAETGMGLNETPLDQSICARVVQETDFAEIEDTQNDPRTRENPLCCGAKGIRFYAGAVLRGDDGLPLGTLCVLDYAPRTLTPLQRDTLRVLGRQVMAQLELRKALRVAETLALEVDHRVKNSLQSLTSFIRFQQRVNHTPALATTVRGIASRIDAMTRLHDQLLRSKPNARLDLGLYVEAICSNAAHLAPHGVSVTADTDQVFVEAQHAVSVGTFLNEALANAFKHAFPSSRMGAVHVRLLARPGGNVQILCSDDGIGTGGDPATEGLGLGTQIADIISQELGGVFEVYSSERGTVTELNFPLQPVA